MADEEKVEKPKQNKFAKLVNFSEKSLDGENTQTKNVQGRELNPEEMEIKNLAVDFWNSYGKDHQDDVESWANHDKGKKLIKHFVSDGENQDLYTNCAEYKNCFDAYQKVKGDNNYNYDESSVDFSRIQTPYDVSFYIVLDGFPVWLLSATNQHTKNFVMSKFKEGESILSIVKVANEKLGKASTKKEGDKESQKEDKENESENEEPKKEDESKSPKEQQEEHKHEKHEMDAFCIACAKKETIEQILSGKFSDVFNEYQKSYLLEINNEGRQLTDEVIGVFKNLGNKEFAKDYFSKNPNQFDVKALDNYKKAFEEMSSQIENKIDTKEYEKYNNKKSIDGADGDFLKDKSQNSTETGMEQ